MRTKLKHLKAERYITLAISIFCAFIGTYALFIVFCPWIQFLFYGLAIFTFFESHDAKTEYNQIVDEFNQRATK